MKIRGMRVELGEIEHALLQHPSMKHTAVIASGEGERRCLIAFYSVHSSDPGSDTILAHLRCLLPDYMLPTRCIKLAQMPLTAHSKIDRASLLSLSVPLRVECRKDIGRPGTIEHTVSTVWRTILEHDDFDLDKGFFEVGGNSLLLVRVYAGLPEEYRLVVALPDLLRYPTIRSVAHKIRAMLDDPSPGEQPVGGCQPHTKEGLESLRLRRSRFWRSEVAGAGGSHD